MAHSYRPPFLDLDAKSLADWRDGHISRLLIEYLAWKVDTSNYECAAKLRKGKKDEAMSDAGKADGFEELLALIHRADPPAEPTEAPTPDPAYRFNPEMAPTQENANAGTE